MTDGQAPAAGPGLLFVSDAVVRQVLTPAVAVQICQEMLRAQARGQVIYAEPRLMTLNTDGHAAVYPTRYLVKGCILPELGVAAMRVMSKHPDRSEHGAGTKYILLSDPAVGLWYAMVDEEYQHKLRTGAAAAAAVRILARPGAVRVGLIGAGPMARTTLTALAEVLAIAEVRVSSRTPASREALAAWAARDLQLPARPVDSVQAAARDVDVVVTATNATSPVLNEAWLAPGAVIYAMGDFQEAEDAVYARVDRFVADDWEQVQVRADIQRLLSAGVLTPDRVSSLWEIAGGLKPGRQRPDERILVRSQGLVSQDVAIARWVYQEVRRRGLGQIL